jgi:hypothetical protein
MQVPVQRALHPVFEAVVNGIHAAEERFGEAVAAEGRSKCVFTVFNSRVAGRPGRANPAVAGFTVVDNGGGLRREPQRV